MSLSICSPVELSIVVFVVEVNGIVAIGHRRNAFRKLIVTLLVFVVLTKLAVILKR